MTPLEIVLYTQQQVKTKLQRIQSCCEYSRILSLESLVGESVSQQQDVSSSNMFEEARSLGSKVSGKKPHTYPLLNKFGNRANELYGLANQEQLSKLIE